MPSRRAGSSRNSGDPPAQPNESLELMYETPEETGSRLSSGTRSSSWDSRSSSSVTSDGGTCSPTPASPFPTRSSSGTPQRDSPGPPPRTRTQRWRVLDVRRRSTKRPCHPGAEFNAPDLLSYNPASSLARAACEVRWRATGYLTRPNILQGSNAGDLEAQRQRVSSRFEGWPGSRLIPSGAQARAAPCPFSCPGRMFATSAGAIRKCLEACVFASNRPLDTQGVQPGWVGLLHDKGRRVIYGLYQVESMGTNLDPSFGPTLVCQARVRPVRMFRPLPEDVFLLVHGWKRDHGTGLALEYFRRDLSPAQTEALWRLWEFWDRH
ncbi:hypothetical protein ACKKBF_B05145 [Auxenochlorella protothecoides x Auxenochlorella symbiontica]